MQTLLASYFRIVKKNGTFHGVNVSEDVEYDIYCFNDDIWAVMDSVPKIIMHFLVNQAKDLLQGRYVFI